MRVGVVFPQTEIGTDPALIKDYAQTAEELGFLHFLAYDHVIGANPASRPGWKPPYSHLDTFHEPLVLFGYLGGLTKKVEFSQSPPGICHRAPSAETSRRQAWRDGATRARRCRRT